VVTLAVLVLAFVLLSPGGNDKPASNGATTTGGAAPPPATAGAATTTTGAAPAAGHQPTFDTIRVAGGKPSGGIKKITLKQGERAHIEVTSPDTTDEIHLHGYDLKRDLKAGGTVRFEFDADAEGIFEIELEGAGTQIGELTVEP
jgi:hypothetical protein